jgi:hypothetical protein
MLVCGSFIREGRVDHDAFIQRLSATNTVEWTWTTDTPEEEEQLLDIEPAGGGAVAGGIWRGAADSDAYLVHILADGNLAWAHHYGTSNDEKLNGVTPQGSGYTGVGRILNPTGESDTYILRTDGAGAELEWQSWGDIANEEFHDVVLRTTDAIMVGTTDSYGDTTDTGHRYQHLYLMALDPQGDTLWTNVIGDTERDHEAFAIAVTDIGDLLLGGTATLDAKSDALTVRTNPTGDPIWIRYYDLQRHDKIQDLQAIPGGFVATGRCFGPQGGEVLLMRKDLLGE